MKSRSVIATASLSALGLGASAVLLADYTSSAGSVCAVGGGCDEVKNSVFASLAGIPTPLFGVVFFAGLLLMSALGRPAHRVQYLVSAAGACAAIVLLALQAFVIGAFCKFCLVADFAAVGYFVVLSSDRGRSPTPLALRLPATAAALAAAGAFYLGASSPSDLARPRSSDVALTASAPSRDGLATIVEFVDFECPACRALHQSLERVLEPYRDTVQVIRRHLPLPQHQHASDAARGYVCAEEAGVSEAMADRLFAATELGPEAIAAIARDVGVDPESYRACMDSPLPEERLAADEADARRLGVRALPTVFVGTTRFDGVPETGALIASIEAALAEQATSPPGE